MKPNNLILECVVGSHMYNLQTETSDIDIKGIFLERPEKFWSLDSPREGTEHTDPDYSYKELRKYCKLCLSMNPTMLELLYANEYTVLTDIGKELVSLRDSFLHKGAIKSFLGYALSQVKRKYRNASDITEYRAGKHVRHTWRLCKQYEQLATTGFLQPKLTDEEREECFKFQELSYNEVLDWFLEEEKRLKALPSVLPDKPNKEAINEFLVRTYKTLLKEENDY